MKKFASSLPLDTLLASPKYKKSISFDSAGAGIHDDSVRHLEFSESSRSP
jgi:hypothetical protein